MAAVKKKQSSAHRTHKYCFAIFIGKEQIGLVKMYLSQGYKIQKIPEKVRVVA